MHAIFKPLPMAVAVGLAALSSQIHAQTGLLDLGSLAGHSTTAQAISSNGLVVAGDSIIDPGLHTAHAFRWTESGGMTDLGTLGGAHSIAHGISADGSVVVGEANNASATDRAFRWTSSGGMVDLGTLGGANSSAGAVSADGNVVVGSAQDGLNRYRAFRWTSTGGMADLGTLGGNHAEAAAVSADGNVVAGFAYIDAMNAHAFRWANGSMSDLGTLGGSRSWAAGISGDGQVVVGESQRAGNNPLANHAFRWTNASGMVDLGTLGGSSSEANAASFDGSVVVGGADDAQDVYQAFRWTQASGMQSVESWLRANGADIQEGLTDYATAVSADGNVLVGELRNGHAFLARAESGLLQLDPELSQSLHAMSGGSQQLLGSANVVVNGLHSQPLAYRVAEGQSGLWLGGDWGQYKSGSPDGKLAIGELGGGHNFGAVQLNAGLGYVRSSQELDQANDPKLHGSYLYTEALGRLHGNLWGVLSAFYQQGDLDLSRTYESNGSTTSNSGSSDTRVWGLRARAEWEQALQLAGLGLSPYGEIAYSDAKVDHYREDEGPGRFPVEYDSRKDQATDARLGVNGSYPLAFGRQTQLLSQLEYVHRFEDQAADLNGRLLGQGGFAFDFAGADYDQDWVRGGVGIESLLGAGKASLMLNASTEGEAPTHWLSARYQLAF